MKTFGNDTPQLNSSTWWGRCLCIDLLTFLIFTENGRNIKSPKTSSATKQKMSFSKTLSKFFLQTKKTTFYCCTNYIKDTKGRFYKLPKTVIILLCDWSIVISLSKCLASSVFPSLYKKNPQNLHKLRKDLLFQRHFNTKPKFILVRLKYFEKWNFICDHAVGWFTALLTLERLIWRILICAIRSDRCFKHFVVRDVDFMHKWDKTTIGILRSLYWY